MSEFEWVKSAIGKKKASSSVVSRQSSVVSRRRRRQRPRNNKENDDDEDDDDEDDEDDARRDGARILFRRCVFVVVVARWERVFTADDDRERSTRRIFRIFGAGRPVFVRPANEQRSRLECFVSRRFCIRGREETKEFLYEF